MIAARPAPAAVGRGQGGETAEAQGGDYNDLSAGANDDKEGDKELLSAC